MSTGVSAIAAVVMILAIAFPALASGEAATAPAMADDLATIAHRLAAASTPAAGRQVDELVSGAKATAASLRPDGSWADVNYHDETRSNWAARAHLDRMTLLARADHALRAAGRSAEAARLDLSASAISALRYWLDNDFQNPNWWHNQIGTPRAVGATLLLLRQDSPPGDERTLRDLIDRATPILLRADWTKWTGQNLVWGVGIQVVRGCLRDEPDVVAAAYRRLYEEVRIAGDGEEGIQLDNSFHQHGQQLYSGGYGLAFAVDVGEYIACAWGTRMQIPAEKLAIYSAYMLDGEQWMIRGGVFDYSAVGREIVRKGKRATPLAWQTTPAEPSEATSGIAQAVTLLSQLDIPRSHEFSAFSARLRNAPQAPPLNGNRMFWRSDYMVHRRPTFLASVKMLSSRMINAELVNSEGRRSHHLSEGATFFYVDGGEYRDIFPVWDWRKIPGTTAEQFELSDRAGIRFRGETSFVGGVSDGRDGLAAMDLKRGDLTGRKAWAFLGDTIVCLGAGITSTAAEDVVTSIDQCLLNGVPYLAAAEGPAPVREQDQSPAGVRWVHHGQIGYVFPAPAPLRITQGHRTGTWRDIAGTDPAPAEADVFALWIDHGVHPQNATYRYYVLPGVSRSQMLDRVLNSSAIEILSNTSSLQAVRDPSTGVTAAAFWEPGSIRAGSHAIAVAHPCLLLARPANNALSLSLSTPAAGAMKLTVTIDEGRTVRFDLPDALQAGSTVSKTLDLP